MVKLDIHVEMPVSSVSNGTELAGRVSAALNGLYPMGNVIRWSVALIEDEPDSLEGIGGERVVRLEVN